jgi:hypothetical protein
MRAMHEGQCRWCGRWHGPVCPRVQAIEYHPDGTVKRVEFRQAPSNVTVHRRVDCRPSAVEIHPDMTEITKCEIRGIVADMMARGMLRTPP